MESIKTLEFKNYRDILAYLCSSEENRLIFNLNEEIFKDVTKDLKEERQNILTGIYKNLLSSSKIEDGKLIVIRKNIENFRKELFDLIEDLIFNNILEKNITSDLLAIAKSNSLSKNETDFILNENFSKLMKRGYERRGFKCLLVIDEGEYLFKRKLYCEYAVKFFNKRNVPWVDVYEIVNKDIDKITEENCKYLYSTKYSSLWKSLSSRNIPEDNVFVFDSEFKEFYSDGNHDFCNITKARLNSWWENGDSLYKKSLNLEKTENSWGFNLICWEDKLIEVAYNKNYISENFTMEDYNLICKNREDTTLAKDILRKIHVNSLSDDEKNATLNQLSTVEESINDLLKENELELLRKTVSDFLHVDINSLSNCSKDELISKMRSVNTGFDCGFSYFKFDNTPRNKKLLSLYKEADAIKGRYSLSIKKPFFTQSTTIQKITNKYVIELISEKLNIDVYSWTELD